MIKFKTPADRVAFLTDLGKWEYLDAPEETTVKDLSEIFFNTNKLRTHALVDFKKSQITKHQWNTNRWDMMKGIHKFHRSIAGKRFHRSIGRFLATRFFEPGRIRTLSSLRSEAAKAVSSIRTHFYIEEQYYRPLQEDVEFQMLFDYSIPLLASVESKIYQNAAEDLTEDEVELLFRLTDISESVKAFKEYGVNVDIAEDAIMQPLTYFITNEFFVKK